MQGASVMEMSRLRRVGHHQCLACTHPDLKLHFTLDGPHRLRSSINFTKEMMSFNGMIHGGLIALLMDEAMTCALMAEGHYCATGELKIRYHQPTRPGPTAHIVVEVESRFGKMYRLKAEMKQQGVLCASAQARFMTLLE
jgi:uncharacterized protein (TIGR00369 family)